MSNTKNLVDGSGWESAYSAQTAKDEDLVAFLWQEQPIAFLQDPPLICRLRGANVVRVLDAGCGDGRNAFALADLGFWVFGMDQSPTAISRAVERAVRQNQNRVLFMEGDITKLNVAGPFDLVLAADVLGQLEDPRPALAKFQQILRPGGVFLGNFYSVLDGTYGSGTKLDELTFEYKGTLFKYFDESAVSKLFEGWDAVCITIFTWLDGPHGLYRPYAHTHHSFVVLAQKPQELK
jgi:SAM-dependent methyltransferase